MPVEGHDGEIASIVQGVIRLSWRRGREGMTRRFVEVEKFRGSRYGEGEHPLRIERGGIEVFPRLLLLDHGRGTDHQAVSTGIGELDAMLGGGLERGTSTLITGNAGVGKTTLGMTVIAHAVERGERCVLYTFDEGADEIIHRGEAIGLALRKSIDAGLLDVRQVNPLLLYPDEFASWVQAEVEGRHARVVMIDSLNGYNQSMPDENYLGGHMHQLIGYLNRMGVRTLLINEISAMIGDFAASQFGVSYMADNVLMIRYFEFDGALHKAIGTIKKRLSGHEKTLRWFDVTARGIEVGDTLPNLRGILRGEASRGPMHLDDGGGPDG